MKSFLLSFVLATAMMAAAEMKIGTVNMVDLVTLHPSYETNRALLKSTDADYKAKLDKQQEDLKAIADEGKKAQEVGIKPIWCSGPDGWGPSPVGRFVDVMAQDGMQECFCDKCRGARIPP